MRLARPLDLGMRYPGAAFLRTRPTAMHHMRVHLFISCTPSPTAHPHKQLVLPPLSPSLSFLPRYTESFELRNGKPVKKRRKKIAVPETCKDAKYWERRRRNCLAAQKVRARKKLEKLGTKGTKGTKGTVDSNSKGTELFLETFSRPIPGPPATPE